MKKLPVLPLFLIFFFCGPAAAGEFSGRLAVEGTFFLDSPLFFKQSSDNPSFSFQPEYYHEGENGSSFTAVPFLRIDPNDEKRSHFDLREFNYLWLGESYELRVGIGKVFWGATEFVHLVDVINQTDAVESAYGEEKLGQPMLHFSTPRDWGVIDLFVLPCFRERTFRGEAGRLRSELVVDTKETRYENPAKERHVDYGFRYSHTLGDWDLGVSHFSGTGRDPLLLADLDDDDEPFLLPYYAQMNQTGLDLQGVVGEWLFKLEALYRRGKKLDNDDKGNELAEIELDKLTYYSFEEEYYALTGGFEYTYTAFAQTNMDLGVIGEWVYDDRGPDDATTPYENDVMGGARLAFNDIASSEFLVFLVKDYINNSQIWAIESSRRIGENLKLEINSSLFTLTDDDLLYDLRQDDFLKIELAYYF